MKACFIFTRVVSVPANNKPVALRSPPDFVCFSLQHSFHHCSRLKMSQSTHAFHRFMQLPLRSYFDNPSGSIRKDWSSRWCFCCRSPTPQQSNYLIQSWSHSWAFPLEIDVSYFLAYLSKSLVSMLRHDDDIHHSSSWCHQSSNPVRIAIIFWFGLVSSKPPTTPTTTPSSMLIWIMDNWQDLNKTF